MKPQPHSLRVELGRCSYDIRIGAGLHGDRELLAEIGGLPRPALLVAGAGVPDAMADACFQALATATPNAQLLRLDDRETGKTLRGAEAVWHRLAELRYGRDCVLYALGGGVTSDVTGFAASAWQRGCDFVALPTTLLAQVDASVGGKTGVNLPQGKNLVGAFHQPRGVLVDTDAVRTQDSRERLAGMAEIIKYGLACDAGFFAWLERRLEALAELREEELCEAVRRSCAIKAAVVAEDERDSTGARALLNFGHTLGHAIEATQDYGGLNHGEAVAVGMYRAVLLSGHLGLLDDGDGARARRLLERSGLPLSVPQGLEADALLDAMRIDKKNSAQRLRLVLLRGLGRAVLLDAEDAGATAPVLKKVLLDSA